MDGVEENLMLLIATESSAVMRFTQCGHSSRTTPLICTSTNDEGYRTVDRFCFESVLTKMARRKKNLAHGTSTRYQH